MSYQTRTGQQRRDSQAQMVTDAPGGRQVRPAGPTSTSHTLTHGVPCVPRHLHSVQPHPDGHTAEDRGGGLVPTSLAKRSPSIAFLNRETRLAELAQSAWLAMANRLTRYGAGIPLDASAYTLQPGSQHPDANAGVSAVRGAG